MKQCYNHSAPAGGRMRIDSRKVGALKDLARPNSPKRSGDPAGYFLVMSKAKGIPSDGVRNYRQGVGPTLFHSSPAIGRQRPARWGPPFFVTEDKGKSAE